MDIETQVLALQVYVNAKWREGARHEDRSEDLIAHGIISRLINIETDVQPYLTKMGYVLDVDWPKEYNGVVHYTFQTPYGYASNTAKDPRGDHFMRSLMESIYSVQSMLSPGTSDADRALVAMNAGHPWRARFYIWRSKCRLEWLLFKERRGWLKVKRKKK